MKFLKKQIIYWVPVYLYMGVIFYFSSKGNLSISVGGTVGVVNISYVQHAFLFFGLGFLILRAFGSKRKIVSSIILSGFYGVSDEFHQYFVPGRTVSLGDVVFDIIGASIGVGVYYLFLKFKK